MNDLLHEAFFLYALKKSVSETKIFFLIVHTGNKTGGKIIQSFVVNNSNLPTLPETFSVV